MIRTIRDAWESLLFTRPFLYVALLGAGLTILHEMLSFGFLGMAAGALALTGLHLDAVIRPIAALGTQGPAACRRSAQRWLRFHPFGLWRHTARRALEAVCLMVEGDEAAARRLFAELEEPGLPPARRWLARWARLRTLFHLGRHAEIVAEDLEQIEDIRNVAAVQCLLLAAHSFERLGDPAAASALAGRAARGLERAGWFLVPGLSRIHGVELQAEPARLR